MADDGKPRAPGELDDLPELVTADTLAGLFQVSARRVRQLVKEGVVPKARHGQYPLVAAVQGYTRFLSERIYGGGESSPDFYSEKTRLTAAQAQKIELEVARQRGLLVPADDLARALEWFVTSARARLLGLPRRMALALAPDNPKAVAAKLEHEVNAILEECASDESLPDWLHTGPQADDGSPEGAADDAPAKPTPKRKRRARRGKSHRRRVPKGARGVATAPEADG